jgi:hypothetical protein
MALVCVGAESGRKRGAGGAKVCLNGESTSVKVFLGRVFHGSELPGMKVQPC